MNRLLLYTCLIFSITILSCQKKKQNIPVPYPELETVFGKWKLVWHSGGGGGASQTAEEFGYTASIVIYQTGSIYHYKNDKFVRKNKFTFGEERGAEGRYKMLTQDDFNYWVRIAPDTLFLDPIANDVSDLIFIKADN